MTFVSITTDPIAITIPAGATYAGDYLIDPAPVNGAPPSAPWSRKGRARLPSVLRTVPFLSSLVANGAIGITGGIFARFFSMRRRFPTLPDYRTLRLQTRAGDLRTLAQWSDEAGLAGLAAEQWQVENEPSVSGDVVRIDVDSLPEEPGYTAGFFEVAAEGASGAGPVISRLLMGPATNYIRRVRVAAERSNEVMIRVVWIEDGTGFELAGRWSAPKSVTPTLGAPSVEIEASRGGVPGEAAAPAGIQFAATGLGFGVLRPFHHLRYKWTFPETGDWKRLSPDQPWPRERSVSYGPIAAFTFETPGTHTVLCEATDGVRTATGKIEVVVDDPGNVFARLDTFVVSNTESWDGEIPGAQRHRSLNAALKAARGARVKRILLRRGDTFDEGGSIRNVGRVQIGAFGEGADPVLRGGLGAREISGEVSVWGLDFRGGYDAAALGPQERPFDAMTFGVLECHATAHDCSMTGIDTGIRPAGPGGTTVVTDCRVENWHDYGIQGGDVGTFAASGVTLLQSSQAIFKGQGGTHKGDAGPPRLADHGPIRLSRPDGAISFDNCDFFTNSDWFTNPGATQPVYRLNTGGVFPTRIVLSRQRTEGGSLIFGVGNKGRISPSDLLIDKLHHVVTKVGDAMVKILCGGATLRNSILVHDDVPPESSRAMSKIFRLGSPHRKKGQYGTINDSEYNPIEIYNITAVDLRRPLYQIGNNGVRQELDIRKMEREPQATLSMSNLVFYAPDLTDPRIAGVPLDTARGPMPRYPGRRVFGEVLFDYIEGNATIRNDTRVTGSRSGAIGLLTTFGAPEHGSFETSDAAGVLSIVEMEGSFRPGDVIENDGGGRLILAERLTSPTGLITRFGNTPQATASFRPLPGSAAIGDADPDAIVAIDDITGALRPGMDGGPEGQPSRGAAEPARGGNG